LHYADFLSLHYIVYESISCNHGTKLNYCQLPSYIHHRATFSSTLSYILQQCVHRKITIVTDPMITFRSIVDFDPKTVIY